jgi:hypothetical protein
MRCRHLFFLCVWVSLWFTSRSSSQTQSQEPNTWIKRSPLKDAPRSPSLGYEASFGYDPVAKRVIRWAGHNQGGGGEQNAETWTYDPATAKWELREPNLSPPGVCCAQQNVFDPAGGRFLRFQGFSGNHGWQWFREIYLNNTAVWSYDLAKNTWRDLRTVPAPRLTPLRCASWDSDHEVVVLFGGEGSNEGTLVYDPYDNSFTRTQPAIQPAPRSAGNMAYDARRKLHILFGSQFSDDPHTWAYDLKKNEWIDLKPKVQPPTDKNDAVLAYDEASGLIVASVRAIDATDGKEVQKGHYETWVYLGDENTWKKMNPPEEPPGGGARRRIIVAVPDQNVVLMENYVNPAQKILGVDREQQMWTYRYGQGKQETLLPPVDVQVSCTAQGAAVTWKPSPSPDVTGYILYGGFGDKPWEVKYEELKRFDAKQTQWRDEPLRPTKIPYYYLVVVNAQGQQSRPSAKARLQPRVVEDIVVSVKSPTDVELRWSRPKGAVEPIDYEIERAVVEVYSEDEILRLRKDTPPLEQPSVGAIKAIGPFVSVSQSARQIEIFTDRGLDLRKPAAPYGEPIYVRKTVVDQLNPEGKPYRFPVYAYRVRAMNARGIRGGAGPFALTIPSSPQWLFSKEEGGKCHLKWAANKEEGITGYRVYRMESPRINGPGQPVTRLTKDPITEPRFVDENAGKVTRRYWVVAVDALGQEGFPSAPTWHWRQFRDYYVPFTGEWHQ